MKFPNHIILDINKQLSSYSSQYWIFKYFISIKKNKNMFNSLSFHKKFLLKKENLLLNKLIKNQKKYTIRYNYTNLSNFFSTEKKKAYKSLLKPRIKVKHRLLFSTHYSKQAYDFLINPKLTFDEKMLKRLIKNFSFKPKSPIFKATNLWSLFDINFLKKEKIYTKLKYSRVPQYDIVSGGVAALFAGFLGFLICEKFGFELGDSGDFYYLFMYVVFILFFCRLFLRIFDGELSSWNIISIKWFFLFYKTIFILIFKKIKVFLNFFKFF